MIKRTATPFIKRLENDLIEILSELSTINIDKDRGNLLNTRISKATAGDFLHEVKNRLDVEISAANFLKDPTVNNLINIIKINAVRERVSKRSKARSTIKKAPSRRYYTLSHAQKRMWVLYNLEPGSSYNIKLAKRLTGELNITALKKAVISLQKRHESLRTNFKEVDGIPVQVIRERPRTELEIVGMSKSNKNKKGEERNEIDKIIKKQTQTPFKLETESLIRFSLIKRKKR